VNDLEMCSDKELDEIAGIEVLDGKMQSGNLHFEYEETIMKWNPTSSTKHAQMLMDKIVGVYPKTREKRPVLKILNEMGLIGPLFASPRQKTIATILTKRLGK